MDIMVPDYAAVPMGTSIMWTVALLGFARCGKWRHHGVCAPPRRSGGFRCWWIPVIIFTVLWLRGYHHRHWSHSLVATPAARVPADQNSCQSLQVVIFPDKCERRGVDPSEMANGLVSLADSLSNFYIERARLNHEDVLTPDLADLEKAPIHTSRDEAVELRNVAQLAIVAAPGNRHAPIGAIHIVGSGVRPRHFPKMMGFFSELTRNLQSMIALRGPGEPPRFRIEHRHDAIALKLLPVEQLLASRLPKPATPLDIPKPPTDEILARTAQPISSSKESTQQGHVSALVNALVEFALAWAHGDDDDDGGAAGRSLVEAKREVAARAANAVAEAAAAHSGAIASVKAAIETAVGAKESVPQSPAAAPVPPVSPAPESADASGRPKWVDSPPPQQFAEHGKFVLTGSTGAFYATPQESRKALAEVVHDLTNSYIETVLGPDAVGQIDPLSIHRTPITWTGSVERSGGLTYYETHALLEFNEQDHRALVRRWRQLHTQHQALMAAIAGGAVLLLLGTVLGYLKLDTLTRGYYSGRLKLAAGTIGLAVITLTALAFTGEIRW